MLYITAYCSYRTTNQASSFYLTLLWELVGIYIKDIAIILFVTPAACLWFADWIHNRTTEKPDHSLEHWIISLSVVFVASYIVLALIPSSFTGSVAYNDNAPQ